MLNSLPYHVTSRKATNTRKGIHMASFAELAWAMSFAHNHRRDYRDGHEIVIWYGHSTADRPNDWSLNGTIACEGI